MATREQRPIDVWGDKRVEPGEGRDLSISVTEGYSGLAIKIPIHVRRGLDTGPVVFVTAALHGDEINGTGAIRTLITDEELHLRRGAIIMVPVLNIIAFERHSRYLPDRRDLNRCFPGTKSGSLASRMARVIFDEIVSRSNYGIDLHTAAVRRTNFPNVRADMADPRVKALAKAFGSEFIFNGRGPKGAFRRSACAAGCPTLILEGGEVWKVENTIAASAIKGVRNVLQWLDMIDGEPQTPPFQLTIEKAKWMRAERGGFLQFHVVPGEIVRQGQPLVTNASLLGRERNVILAPFDAVVTGMTTLPAISPGEPICHLGMLPRSARKIEQIRDRLDDDSLHLRTMGDLASNIMVVEREEEA